MEPDVYFKSPVLSLLLKWCQAVCGYYDMKVSNGINKGENLECVIYRDIS